MNFYSEHIELINLQDQPVGLKLLVEQECTMSRQFLKIYT